MCVHIHEHISETNILFSPGFFSDCIFFVPVERFISYVARRLKHYVGKYEI